METIAMKQLPRQFLGGLSGALKCRATTSP